MEALMPAVTIYHRILWALGTLTLGGLCISLRQHKVYFIPLWDWTWRNCLGRVETRTLFLLARKYATSTDDAVEMQAMAIVQS